MQIRAMFAKQIDRSIEGVVKADDTGNLKVEVDEYVLTRDAAKGVSPLLEEYTHYTNANGVWISGFFGSGKSHLLKMLAHLLGDVPNQAFPRKEVVESFLAKTDDEFLRSLIIRSSSIPATSLLFNIDQKATLIAKDQRDALLKVFVKVFNEARGFYGGDGAVAKFEQDLSLRGQYDDFKAAFARHAGIDWELGREQSVLEASNIDAAYSEVHGAATSGIIDQYRSSYAVSIEDFAASVNAWLRDKPQNYHLNFFVDEVGQFIADDVQLMLNLQTIAETLNTVCHGRSWVFVTSQEDMEKVVGDRDKKQANDFSKIQARFATRVKLTSQDVEEVISKRLLDKTDGAATSLERLYDEQHENFSTLFSFGDGSKSFKNYSDLRHFTATYPFVPYQIQMFQSAIEGLSDHNMFEGRNSSVGERSMLGVIQQVATAIGTEEMGYLASFDQMFAGISAALKSAAQSAVLQAEKHLPQPDSDVTVMANRLLKALLLVKYVEGFKATARNLSVLVYNQFGQDLRALNGVVAEALDLLENQSYVQRNGAVYEYLTNEEQEIEKEIKNLEIDTPEFSSRLVKHLTADVLQASKFRFDRTGQDFGFGIKLDDTVHGLQKPLTIHFMTGDYPASPEEVLAQSTGLDELRVVLPKDSRLMRDLMLIIKTEKYIKLRTSAGAAPTTQAILQTKQVINSERVKELIERLRRAVGQAQMIINGAEVTSGASDPVSRINDGFQQLITKVYRNLYRVADIHLGENDVPAIVRHESTLFDRGETIDALEPVAEEILSWISMQAAIGQQATIKKIVDTFEAKPYGWRVGVVEVLVAWLVANGKVSLTRDSTAVPRDSAASVITNTATHAFVVVAPRREYDQDQVSRLRAFCSEFFDTQDLPSDAEELGQWTVEHLRAQREELRKEVAAGQRFPFIAQLSAAADALDEVCGHDAAWFVTDFNRGDELYTVKEETIRPILEFIRGSQSRIFDDASNYLTTNVENLDLLPSSHADKVKALLTDPSLFRNQKMPDLKAATEALRTQIDDALTQARREVAAGMEQRRHAVIQADASYSQATPEAQAAAMSQVDDEIARLETLSRLGLIQHRGDEFAAHIVPAILQSLNASKTVDPVDPDPVEQPQWVSIKAFDISRCPDVPTTLRTKDDVDTYLDMLRNELLAALDSGKTISL